MLKVAAILIIGLLPPLASVWMMRKMGSQVQNRIMAARRRSQTRIRYQSIHSTQTLSSPEQHEVEGLGLIIGDLSCRFNARSPYLRCAVNPDGPCQGCSAYQEL